MTRRFLPLLLALSLIACNLITPLAPTALPASPAPASPTVAGETPLPGPTDTPQARPSRTPRPTRTASPPETPTASPTEHEEWRQIFRALWIDVRDNYVYPDYRGLDWDAVYDEFLPRVDAASNAEEFYDLMREMIDRLGDDHSRFLSPDEAREDDQAAQGQLDYVGIGIIRDLLEGKRSVVILLVFPGSPAEKAGLRSHDSILAINGTPVIDEQGNSHIDEIRGPEGTQVVLTVRSVGQEPRDVTITRERIVAQYPVAARRLDGDIGYLMIPTLYDETIGDRVIAAYQEMAESGAPLKGLVVDLRLNGGGFDTILKQLLGLFTQGTVGNFLDHGEREPLTIDGNDVDGSQSVPLVVLVGHGTQSFAEVFSGVLQDVDRAKVVGITTTGNVEINWAHDYEDGSRAWIAQQTFQPLHSSANWEDTGIVPDVTVQAEWDAFSDDNDPQLQAAVDLLQK